MGVPRKHLLARPVGHLASRERWGAWQGRGSGVASQPGYGDIIAFWYTGTGDYASLSYLEQWTGSDPWAIQGLIFPGDPPTP